MREFENFISYRRSETMGVVKNLYDSLIERGYSTFCDIYSLDNGDFNENILETIGNCTNFILVINKRSLDRCTNRDDWLYKEIYHAIKTRKNIVCVFDGDASFPDYLPLEISSIRHQNGTSINFKYYESFIDELVSRFLVEEDCGTVSNEKRDFVIDDGVLISYVGNAKVIDIPTSVKVIGNGAFKDKTRITRVNLSENVEVIKESAFSRCISLNNLKLSENVKIIEAKAFHRCSGLAYVELNAYLEKIGKEAFSFCSKLKWIKLTNNIYSIDSSAFNGCSKLKQFEVEDSKHFVSENGILMDKDKTTVIRCPENYNDDIITLPDTIISLEEWSFSRCINVVDVNLSNSIKYIKANAFKDSYNIRSLTIPDSIVEFDVTALSGWTSDQRLTFSKKINPLIKYIIEKHLGISNNVQANDLSCDYILVKTTFESEEEAEIMAKLLLDSKLIISGQISALKSIYLWEGAVNKENEFELSCITVSSKCYDVEKFITSNHSYELCEILVIPVIHTTEEFGKWIMG